MRTKSILALLFTPTLLIGCAVDAAEDESISESEEALTRKTYYVSDLSPRTIENGWGPIELDRAVGEKAAGDGNKISIRGKKYSKGLGVHARSDVRVALDGKCSSFRATIGIDDEAAGSSTGGNAVFSVYADGVKLVESGELAKSHAGMPIAVDVTGSKELQLVVDSNDDHAWDHADWASARVLCSERPSKGGGVTPPPPPPPPSAGVDLFDNSLTSGAALPNPTSLFAAGSSQRPLSKFVFAARSRTCNKLTGCGGWTATTESWLTGPYQAGTGGWYETPTSTANPRGEITGTSELGILKNSFVASLSGKGSKGGELFATNCGISSSCSFSANTTSCYWGSDRTRNCYSYSATLFDATLHLTADALIATSAVISSAANDAGNYSDSQYVVYARVNPSENPVAKAAGSTVWATW